MHVLAVVSPVSVSRYSMVYISTKVLSCIKGIDWHEFLIKSQTILALTFIIINYEKCTKFIKKKCI